MKKETLASLDAPRDVDLQIRIVSLCEKTIVFETRTGNKHLIRRPYNKSWDDVALTLGEIITVRFEDYITKLGKNATYMIKV